MLIIIRPNKSSVTHLRGLDDTRCFQTVKKAGFTLTELAIVLSIVGLILGAIWAAASKVYANHKISRATTQLITIVSGVRSLYAGAGRVDPGDLTIPLVATGIYPSDMLQTSCPGLGAYNITPSPCPVDAWNGGAVQIGGNVGWNGNPDVAPNYFTIMYWDNTMTDCPAFLSNVIQNASAMKLVWAYANGIAPITSPSTASATAVTGCNGYITLTFAL